MEEFFDFLRAPPSVFVKVNFNSSLRNGREGVSYVIGGLNARLLATEGSNLFKPFVPEAKLVLLGWTSSMRDRSYKRRGSLLMITPPQSSARSETR